MNNSSFFDRDARRSGPTNHFDEVDPNIEFVEAHRSLQIGSDWIRLDDLGISRSTLDTLAACFLTI